MTPEQRFTKIENSLSALAEHYAQHAKDVRELRRMHKGLVIAVVKIADAQRTTEEKLHTLIDTVDRIIRGLK